MSLLTTKTVLVLSSPLNLTWMAAGFYFGLRKPAGWPVERRRRVFGPFFIIGALMLVTAILVGRT